MGKSDKTGFDKNRKTYDSDVAGPAKAFVVAMGDALTEWSRTCSIMIHDAFIDAYGTHGDHDEGNAHQVWLYETSQRSVSARTSANESKRYASSTLVR